MEIEEMVRRANDLTDYMYDVEPVAGTPRPTVRVGHWFWGTIGFLELDQVRSSFHVVNRNGDRHASFSEHEFKVAADYLMDAFFGALT